MEVVEQYIVDGKAVERKHISRRSMNFGQHWRTEGIEDLDYHVEIPVDFVTGYLDPEIADFIEDSIQHPDPDDPLEALLKQENWPKSSRSIIQSNNNALKSELLDFYATDILLEWFGDKPNVEKGFILNTIDRIQFRQMSISFEGTCRDMEKPVRYQDW